MYREKTEKALDYLKADRELARTLLVNGIDEELKERVALKKEVLDHTINVLEAMKIIIEDPVISQLLDLLYKI